MGSPSLPQLLLWISCIVRQVIGIPITGLSPPTIDSLDATTLSPRAPPVSWNPGLNLIPPHPLTDWENFAHPIPNTNRVLKGRIFTTKPLRPSSVHHMLDGSLAESNDQIAKNGIKTRLLNEDNPWVYSIPGCQFWVASKIARGRATMTYGMVGEGLKALRELMEEGERALEVSFVLTDREGVSWGHGGVMG